MNLINPVAVAFGFSHVTHELERLLVVVVAGFLTLSF